MNAEQSNSSVTYDKRLVMKMFRRVEPGLNPDLEICAFLTRNRRFEMCPRLLDTSNTWMNREPEVRLECFKVTSQIKAMPGS